MLLGPLIVATAIHGQTMNVFAAASLKEAFTQIAREFEKGHAGVKVRLQFAGSQQLAAQIKLGAPADVFASAAQSNLDQVAYDKATLVEFARNHLVIAARRNTAHPKTYRQLDQVGKLVVAAPQVPAGRYTEELLGRAAKTLGEGWAARVRARVVSREQDVRAVLAKVVLGEADAGIVYASDAASANEKVRTLPFPASLAHSVVYPAAVVTGARQPALAKQFVRYLRDKSSQAILDRAGFDPAAPAKKSG